GNYLEVKNLFDESLLTGFEEITVSFYSKVDTISTGDPNWPFFAAPDASEQQYPYEKYIAVLEQNNRIVVERYYNFGSRPGAISVANTTDWKHVAVVFSKDGTTLYVNGVPTSIPVNYDLRTILGNESILYIGKATWKSTGEYFKGYIDEYKIFDHALTPQEIAQMATRRNVTIKYVTPSGEVLKTETKASFDSVKFELEPAEEIQHDGNVYGYLPSLSTPSIVVSENSNVITLVYGKIQASPVTVRFVDEFGLDIKESEEILLTFGREFNLSMVEGYSETLDGIDANTIYVFTGVEGGGIVGDGTEKEVLLRYKLMNLDTKVMTANRGATIQKSTGRNHHNAEDYKNRIMADSRTWSSSGLMYGLMGFVNEIPQGDIISAVISVYTGADNNSTTARSYELYAVEELGADWDRSTVELGSEWVGATSTFGVPEGLTPVAAVTLPSTLGDGVINEVQFDITGYLKEHANSNLNFIIVSTSADAYGVFHSEITSYKPKLEVKVVSGINMSFTFDGTTARAENVPAGEYTIIVAQYDEDGKLIDLASTSESILTITPKEGAKSAQAFLWHSKSTLVPLAQKIEVEY
ncbi:MAG: LamG domain-containing protein, partial [Clostridiaceae bacterium]|nr:LamG domain-containing protein [Clostridiaceae bacterium]